MWQKYSHLTLIPKPNAKKRGQICKIRFHSTANWSLHSIWMGKWSFGIGMRSTVYNKSLFFLPTMNHSLNHSRGDKAKQTHKVTIAELMRSPLRVHCTVNGNSTKWQWHNSAPLQQTVLKNTISIQWYRPIYLATNAFLKLLSSCLLRTYAYRKLSILVCTSQPRNLYRIKHS